MIEIIKTTISNQSSKVELLDTIYSNNKEQYRVHFIFDTDDWNNYNKMVVFDRVKNYDTPIGINITEENSELVEIVNEKEFYCILPWEVITQAGYFNISIYGTYTNEKGEILKKNYIIPDKFTVQNGGDTTIYPRIPTPNMYEQLVNVSESLKADAAEAKQMAAAASEQAEAALDSTLALKKEIKNKVSQQQVEEMIGAIPTNYVFEDLEELNIYLNSEEFKNKLNIGDSFYIKDREVADYWWDGSNIQSIETMPSNIAELLVGQKTPEGGEIFNDYLENIANAPLSHAEGDSTTTGVYGYKISGIDKFSFDNKGNCIDGMIHTTDKYDPNKNYSDFIGQYVQIDLSNHYYNIFVVKNMNASPTYPDDSDDALYIYFKKEDNSYITEDLSLEEPDTDDDNYVWITTKSTDSAFKGKTDWSSEVLGGNTWVKHHYGAHAEGVVTKSWGLGAHAEGGGSVVAGDFGHAEGKYTSASYAAHSEGERSQAYGYHSHAEGQRTRAWGKNSHSENWGTQANGENSHAEGASSKANGKNSHAEGEGSKASGIGSHSEGAHGVASGNYSHAEGYSTQANGENSHAEGAFSVATGEHSHTEGYYTQANATATHAEGYYSYANGENSHAEGNNTRANGLNSHTEGNQTQASGESSHAEGDLTIASGVKSHAEGGNTIANGNQSHAEGWNTYSNGYQSHAEGRSSKKITSVLDLSTNPSLSDIITKHRSLSSDAKFSYVKGTGAHGEGWDTLALGNASHAEGKDTIANGNNSHTGGQGTIANGTNQTVIGRYNAPNTTDLFIVGNGGGNSDSNRKNAFTVNSDGSAEIQTSGTKDLNVVNYKQLKDYVAQNAKSQWDNACKLLFTEANFNWDDYSISEGGDIYINNHQANRDYSDSYISIGNAYSEGTGHERSLITNSYFQVEHLAFGTNCRMSQNGILLALYNGTDFEYLNDNCPSMHIQGVDYEGETYSVDIGLMGITHQNKFAFWENIVEAANLFSDNYDLQIKNHPISNESFSSITIGEAQSSENGMDFSRLNANGLYVHNVMSKNTGTYDESKVSIRTSCTENVDYKGYIHLEHTIKTSFDFSEINTDNLKITASSIEYNGRIFEWKRIFDAIEKIENTIDVSINGQ